jgi:hypothetical protein
LPALYGRCFPGVKKQKGAIPASCGGNVSGSW